MTLNVQTVTAAVQAFVAEHPTMSVTSLIYLAFFAVVALVHYAHPRIARPYWLLVASYAFFCYESANRMLVPVLLGMTLVTWLCGLLIGKVKVKPVRVLALLVAVASGVGLLVYYKYWNLLSDALGGAVLTRRENMLVPLGLSYFTFAALSYTIDVYKKRSKVELNFFHYALFVSFFPTLITGPIERYPQLRPQIKKTRRFIYGRCAGGAFRMLWGYTKKMVLADNLNLYVSTVYGDVGSASGPNLVVATFLFAIQLYMDFSGCCDIALGAARILGYDLIENFNSPYEATSFGEFWSRWHISMTSWFRDYVYFSLGGSRCAAWRHYLNIIIVFLCSGLWHGADWRYLMWGLSCGVVSVLATMTAKPRAVLQKHNPLYRAAWLRVWLQRFCVWVLFGITLVFFASAYYNTDPYAVYAGVFAGWQGLAGSWKPVAVLLLGSGLDGRLPTMLVVGVLAVFAIEHNGNQVARWMRKQCFVLRWVLYYACAAAILFFAAFGQSVFIYQNY